MGIRFSCPNGHRLNVKTFLAGKRGVCPQCGAKFVIPAADESAVDDSSEPMAIGQSHSVEVTSPTGSQTTTAVASPSVIIAVSESAVSAPPPIQTPAAAPAPMEPKPTELPTSIVEPLQPPKSAGVPVVNTSQSQIAVQRKRSRQFQTVISLFLFALVIVLAFVLVIVMKRHLNETNTVPNEAAPAPATSQ